MRDKQYTHIAEIYMHLMSTVDYKDWADYIFEICEGYDLKPQLVLELACGTGELAGHLSKLFPKIIVTDISIEMLKLHSNNHNYIVCCDMLKIPFKQKFDLVISTFDSVNYLTNENEIELLFREVNELLSPQGIFTFDVSLEANSIANEKHLNREGKINGIIYKQKSEYDKDAKIHLNYFDLEFADGTKLSEVHKQKIYDFNYYFEVINNCGLYVSECFDAFSFDDADENSERVQFIVKHNE